MWTGIAKFSGPGFNNARPREFLERLEGFRKRAHWAHLNSFEAFPPFAAAVIIAHQLALKQSTLDALALTWVAFRVLYGCCYVANQATLRSICWVIAMASWVAMFVMAA
jgi:uncharacterized MAPEG superfamily protein